MIPLKSKEDLVMLKKSGSILAEVLANVCEYVKPGLTTQDVDAYAYELIKKAHVLPAFKGYRGFPATVCISINDEIVHGIPGDRVIKDGDIVSIDLGVNYRGYFSDAAETVAVGNCNAECKKLIQVTKESLRLGIEQMQIGNRLTDISYSIQTYVEKNGFSVVRHFVGHGIGLNLHEEPEVPNFGAAGQGPELKAGMVLAIEPMVNMGTWDSRMQKNGWTAVTADGLASAHFEHTVALTDKGPLVLTKL